MSVIGYPFNPSARCSRLEGQPFVVKAQLARHPDRPVMEPPLHIPPSVHSTIRGDPSWSAPSCRGQIESDPAR